MTKKIILYLKTRRTFSSEELDTLRLTVIEGVAEDISFEVISGFEMPQNIDWTRFHGKPVHPSEEARFLTQEIEGIEIYGGGNAGRGSNQKLINADTIINWIGRLKNDLPPIIPESNRFEEHLFQVEDKWRESKHDLIYKYCSWDTARKFILSGKKTIRLNDIQTMNDPLEFSFLSINLYGGSKDFDPIKYWDAIKKVTKEGVRLFCCSRDNSSNFNEATGYMSQAAVRGFAHPAMWNHYANSHEGVCLIFKKNELNNAISDSLSENGHLLSSEVKYWPNNWSQGYSKDIFPIKKGIEKWSEDILKSYLTKKAIEQQEQLFFSKVSDWQYENEFRWVFLGQETGPIDVPYGEALAGIVLGCDFDSNLHEEARNLARENAVPIRRIWWKNGYAATPWPLEAFEKGDTLEKWEEQAAYRRSKRL